jgi:L-alanine-DL-glutamate epimerase-like enolase superfamily enzyme
MKSDIPSTMGRRAFLQRGVAATAFALSFEEAAEAATQSINTNSKPSELKITDLRVIVLRRAPMNAPIIRIDTNQGIYGLGEVRDGASKNYALMLKSRLLGENPCHVDRLFRKLKQFGGHGRQGGGVSGVEMALWDLAGKAYNVPVYQFLGGKFRDRVRIYTDTPESRDPQQYAQRMKARLEKGYTMLKMDLGYRLVQATPGTVTAPVGLSSQEIRNTPSVFTGVELTDKGIALLADYVAAIRETIGMEVPLAADHFGHIGVNSCIRLGKEIGRAHV